MDMSPQTRRNLLIAGGIALVIIVGLLVWWLTTRTTTPPATTNTTTTNTTVANTDVVVLNSGINATTTNTDSDEVELVRLANLFAERYGSYSTEAGFQNITDLKSYMTQKMQVVSDSFVATQKAQASTGSFLSVTTSALSTSVGELASAKATITVSTQRRQGGTNVNGNETYYQALTLTFVKDKDAWLVDTATWGDKGSY